MTAVMRAMRPSTPMALRVGIVRAGRIVEERVIKEQKSVSVGTAEDATFAVEPTGRGLELPPRFELFARKKDGYVLRFGPGISGRVALGQEVVTFDALRERGIGEVALGDDARGKIVLGDTTLLFQFVHPPVTAARPQLPLSVKSGFVNHVDWSLTIIAALSFLLHFGGVGLMYSDWMDVVVDDHRTVAGLVDMVTHIPPPAVTETPPETTGPTTHETTDAPKPVATKPTSTSTGKATSSSPSKAGPHVVDSHQAAALSAQADQIGVSLLASLNGNSAVDSTLRRSEIPPVDLSSQAASSSGVTGKASDLHIHGGGPAVGAREGGGLSTLANNTQQSGDGKAGDARIVNAPKVEPQVGALTGGSVTGADRVIAGLKGRFRSCYQKGLAADSTMSGKVIIATHIGPNGEVTSADVASNTGLSNDVAQCIAGAVKRAQFDPQAGSMTLSVPVSFVHQ